MERQDHSGFSDPALARDRRPSRLKRQVGLFDATMIVMGGIVGAGIFINPYVVARQVHAPAAILGAWALGGVIALAGAFVYAELAARMPEVGGQYAYLREAYHPAVAFLYGWVLLLVVQTGGMAAVAITFARYLLELVRVPLAESLVAALALGGLAAINCLGVRAGSRVQSVLMVLKILALAALVAAGWFARTRAHLVASAPPVPLPAASPWDAWTAFGAAMVPVLFSYGGYHTANFIAGEVRDPVKNLPRGLLMGVAGVVALYLAVNYVCLRALGPAGLAATTTPASAVLRQAFGPAGAEWIALGIAISALGFLSQSVLTAPRVYYAMAEDGVFFRQVAWLAPRSRVPAVAILLQAACAIVIALAGRYEQILNYVISMDLLFLGLSASCLFVFRRRAPGARPASTVPGHPVTTALFIAACWLVVADTFYKYPGDSGIGLGILLAGLPVYFLWGHRRQRTSA
jgi:basic amino acid/polyamine antiporter, APA family